MSDTRRLEQAQHRQGRAVLFIGVATDRVPHLRPRKSIECRGCTQGVCAHIFVYKPVAHVKCARQVRQRQDAVHAVARRAPHAAGPQVLLDARCVLVSLIHILPLHREHLGLYILVIE